MRVLVTGGTGFIGSHTVRALLESGHDVRLLVRSEEKARRIWAHDPRALKDLVVGDITSGPDVAAALRECEGLVHTAAPVALAVSRSAAKKVARENLRAVRKLVDRALDDGLERIVHLSTTALFDTTGLEKADETTPIVKSGDTYAMSKSAPELYLRQLQDQGAPISIVYPPGVIGPDDPGLSEAMIGIQQFLQASVLVTSSGFQTVDVRDLADVHTALINRDPAPGRFVATGQFLPWDDFAELLDRAAGVRLTRMPLPGRAIRVIGRIGDMIRPFVDLDASISGEATRLATQWVELDGSRTEQVLGIKFRDPHETLFDTVRWLASEGHIDKDRALRFTHPGRGRH